MSRPKENERVREREEREREMQQRKVAGVSGRPIGTDGSDFSYRMVVESRYTKVAEGKSKLYRLIVAQGLIQLLGLLSILLSVTKKESVDTLALASSVISVMSTLLGELGRSRSKVNLLKFFMVASSIAVLISLASLGRCSLLIEVIRDPSLWQMNKFLLVEIMVALLGVLIQILTISTTISLVQNMSPLKRAS